MTNQPTFQKLAETAHKGAEHFHACAQIALDASEKLLAINFGAARSLCESVSASPAPLVGTDIQDTLARQAAAHGRSMEQLGDYVRRVNEVCLEAQSEMMELGSRQFEQLQASMNALLHEARKVSPLATDTDSESRSRAMRKAA
ncbi:MAG TPA: phasin family protein [Rhodocyclaceae bacterium]|nr:phasin family protein [Rhodocyclaceae bacterium]